MTVTLMLCSMLIGTVLAVAALVLHSQERAANRPVRWIWMTMILATVVLTAVVATRGTADSPKVAGITLPLADSLLVSAPLPDDSRLAMLGEWIRGTLALPSAAVAATLESAAGLVSRVPAGVQQGVALAWGGATLLCIALLLAVHRRVRRSADGWRVAQLLGLDVRVSHDAGPAVIGLRPMEIVVPSWILSRSDVEQRLVLQHEQEHIRARDPLLLLSACVAVALMPWNPALWFALSRLRLAVELDCDRRVLRAGTTPNHYARLLLDLSEHPSRLASSLPALSYSASHLERRLLAMTARPSRYLLPRRLAGGAVAGLLVLAACESRMPTSAEVENMDARKAVATASALPGIDTARASYIVDDMVVSKAEAEGYAAASIASIEVVKGKNRASQIRLRTVAGGRDTMTLEASRIRIDSMATGTGDDVRYAPSRVAVAPLMRTVRDSGSFKSPVSEGMSLARARVPGGTSVRMQASKRAFDGIFIIDGKQVSDTVANSLDPNRIESIEVVKGAAASTRYSDPRAINGVIVITTKNP